MPDLIETLKMQEPEMIIRTLAFMSFNPSIGRVFKKGSAGKFSDQAVQRIDTLKKIESIEGFDEFHDKWCNEISQFNVVRTFNNNSYGFQQKGINVFLKVFVDWAGFPGLNNKITLDRLKRYLHVPIDRRMMKMIKKEKKEMRIKAELPTEHILSYLDKTDYMKWQSFFRKEYNDKPVLFDILWAIDKNQVGEKK